MRAITKCGAKTSAAFGGRDHLCLMKQDLTADCWSTLPIKSKAMINHLLSHPFQASAVDAGDFAPLTAMCLPACLAGASALSLSFFQQRASKVLAASKGIPGHLHLSCQLSSSCFQTCNPRKLPSPALARSERIASLVFQVLRVLPTATPGQVTCG